MPTLRYDEYARKSGTKLAIRAQLKPSDDTVAYFGLSPFDVPEAMTVSVLGDDSCIFHFDYPNAERPERSPRKASPDGRVEVILGENTRKVLQVFVQDPKTFLGHNNPQLDSALAAGWRQGVASNVAKSAERSVNLVNTILASMPQAFRREILTAIEAEIADAPQQRVEPLNR
jgi:hypothetical protein